MNIDYSSLIPGTIKAYKDIQCTTELDKENSVYRIILGPEEGFNGTDGEQVYQYIYLKNVGDTNTTDTYIKEVGDNKSYFKLSARGILLADTYIELGTIAPNSIVPIKISSFIPAGASAIDSYINFSIIYSSTPPFDNTYYKEATTPDEVKLKREYTVESTGRKIQEYTVSNIALADISMSYVYVTGEVVQENADVYIATEPKTVTSKVYVLNIDNTDAKMRIPVKIYHGTKDEIYWDEESNKYKVRLKCPNCEKWTNWYDLSTFDYTSELTCSECNFKIKVANTVDFSESSQKIEKLIKYRVPIKAENWTLNTQTNIYQLAIEDHPGAMAINAYRKDGDLYKKVLINISPIDDYILLNTLTPFDGFLVVLQQVELDSSQFKSKTGKVYGKGPYGEANYGQESFIHITDAVNIRLPIQGQDSAIINASFKILTKYTGEEANIEDIQSFYTERYMKLGCYDGPALPLKINNV